MSEANPTPFVDFGDKQKEVAQNERPLAIITSVTSYVTDGVRQGYLIRYLYDKRVYLIQFTDTRRKGFAETLKQLVRDDIEARRYFEDPIEHLKLPISV